MISDPMAAPSTRLMTAVATFWDSGAVVLNGYTTAITVASPMIQVKNICGRGVAIRSRCMIAVATSATREAENGGEFLRAVTQQTGIRPRVISGTEEARLIHQAAVYGVSGSGDAAVVIDIGGGSTEVVTALDGNVRSISMDIGCVRLTERILRDDPPGPEQVEAALAMIERELDRAAGGLKVLAAQSEDAVLVGLAGTVSTLVSLELGLVEYQRDLIHHSGIWPRNRQFPAVRCR